MGLSFAAVFEAEFAPLHRYLERRVGSAVAEDLTAETFTIAYRRWDALQPERPIKPWLYGIAANLLRHHWRAERRMLRAYARIGQDRVFENTHEMPEELQVRAARQPLAAALADLRREEREVLLLNAWADLSDIEIAQALSLPVGTVKSRLSRARAQLRNHLAASGQLGVSSVIATVEEKR
jgi:RNA polymerase sigma-70 factor (ECF subfamily)